MDFQSVYFINKSRNFDVIYSHRICHWPKMKYCLLTKNVYWLNIPSPRCRENILLGLNASTSFKIQELCKCYQIKVIGIICDSMAWSIKSWLTLSLWFQWILLVTLRSVSDVKTIAVYIVMSCATRRTTVEMEVMRKRNTVCLHKTEQQIQ